MAKIRRRKQKRAKRHPLRNLPLKWSFAVYIVACAAAAIVLSALSATFFSELQSEIYHRYEVTYRESYGRPADLVVNGEVVMEDGIWLYTREMQAAFTPEDVRRYDLYGALAVLSVPLVCVLCVIATSLLFYRRKLKPPLRLLDEASGRIAAGDLDFAVVFDNRNEMGRLARSFETMRASLEAANREMWRMMEERKRLNRAFAHDLRTPLTVLKGYADYLLRFLPERRVPEEKITATLAMMRAYIDRLEGYTLSMSRLQNLEEIVPAPLRVPFDALADRLEGAADMLRGSASVRFARAGDGILFVDADLIEQVLENLVANAARYAREAITVDCTLAEGVLRLTVSDDGPGFSAEACRMADAPYYHEAYQDVDAVHFGIGLYVCALLCRKHGGTLCLPGAEGSAQVTAMFASLDADQPKAIPV